MFESNSTLRNQEQRIGRIVQCDPANMFVIMEDRFNGQFQVSLHVHDAIATMPAVDEIWMAKRIGIDWILDKRLENGTETMPFADMEAGDRRVYSPNNMYLAGNAITIQGSEINTQGLVKVDGHINFNVPIQPTSISGSPTDYDVLTSIDGQTQWSSEIYSLIQTVAASLVPVGTVMQYAASGTQSPTGWLICSGTAVSRSQYSNLFNAIGTMYGVGDGSTTFNLPDFRGRVPVGVGTHSDVNLIGKNDGVTNVAYRRPKHRHTAHAHATTGYYQAAQGGSGFEGYGFSSNSGGGSSSFATTSVDGGSGNTNDSLDAPAYIVVNYIIKY